MTDPRASDRLVMALAAALLICTVLFPPAVYLLFSIRYLEGSLENQAEVTAQAVSRLATANPELWRFEQERLEELLAHPPHHGEPEARRIRDRLGQVVAERSSLLPAPRLQRSVPVQDAGQEVGRVEVACSLQAQAIQAGLMMAGLLPIATLAFLLLVAHLRRAPAERHRLEEQLRQAQRLETIGRLAGGVAHDFNNLLAAILSLARELKEELGSDSPHRETVDEILAASQRGVIVTRSLLAFSRRQALERRRVDAGDLVRGLERLLRSTLGPGQTLRLVLADGPLPVRADPVQLELVLVNLATNARDAMEVGGLLEVAASEVEVDRKACQALGLARPGRHVRLSVRDTGHGMDAATRERAFDPFFTTKEVGRGTGLGLSMAHGVIRQHGGAIQVESAPGAGTTVTLLLPADGPLAGQDDAAGRSGDLADARSVGAK